MSRLNGGEVHVKHITIKIISGLVVNLGQLTMN
jgi:hypothetical protein